MNKPDTKEQILCDSTYMRDLATIGIFLESECIIGYQGLGMGEGRVVVKRIYVRKDENVLDIVTVITQHCECI